MHVMDITLLNHQFMMVARRNIVERDLVFGVARNGSIYAMGYGILTRVDYRITTTHNGRVTESIGNITW